MVDSDNKQICHLGCWRPHYLKYHVLMFQKIITKIMCMVYIKFCIVAEIQIEIHYRAQTQVRENLNRPLLVCYHSLLAGVVCYAMQMVGLQEHFFTEIYFGVLAAHVA